MKNLLDLKAYQQILKLSKSTIHVGKQNIALSIHHKAIVKSLTKEKKFNIFVKIIMGSYYVDCEIYCI